MISFSILNHFRDLKKILSCQNFSRLENVIIRNNYDIRCSVYEVIIYLQMHIFALINYQSEQRFLSERKKRDLLSLISLGIEFQRNDPSVHKTSFKTFKLLVRGCGKQRVLEIQLVCR